MSLSLRTHIQFYYALILGAVLLFLGLSFYFHEKALRIKALDAELAAIVPKLHEAMIYFDRRHGIGPHRMSPYAGDSEENGPGQQRPRRPGQVPGGGPPPGRGFPGPPDGRRGPAGELDPTKAESFDITKNPGSPGGPPLRVNPDRAQPGDAELKREKGGVQLLPGWERANSEAPAQEQADLGADEMGAPFEKFYVVRGFYGAIYMGEKGDRIRYRSSNFPALTYPTAPFDGSYYRTRDERFREILNMSHGRHILVGRDTQALGAELNQLKLNLVAGGLTVFLLSLLIGHVLITHRLAPLGAIRDASVLVANGKLGERIDPANLGHTREFDILIKELNTTFSHFESVYGQQVRFTIDASHELKTPLTILIAQIDLALKSPRSAEKYREIFQLCSQSCDRLNRIIRELSEIASFDSGRVSLDQEALPLDDVLRGLSEEMQAYVRSRGCTLSTDLDSGTVEFDPFRMDQVITNLINNALQHNDAPVKILLRSRLEGNFARIEVIDDGKGIRQENLDHIFERFFQEDQSRSRREGRDNTGLGLTICEAIIRLHGGQLKVSSQPGMETRFSILLPIGAER